MEDANNDGYKYLGMLGLNCILHREMKDKIMTAYFFLKSKLNPRKCIKTKHSVWEGDRTRDSHC